MAALPWVCSLGLFVVGLVKLTSGQCPAGSVSDGSSTECFLNQVEDPSNICRRGSFCAGGATDEPGVCCKRRPPAYVRRIKRKTTTPSPARQNCPPVCDISCEFGNVMVKGCPICRCRRRRFKRKTTTPFPITTTCPPLCDVWCEFGNVMVNGCPICQCRLNPVRPTTTSPLPTGPTCPPVCAIWCRFGNVMVNGCPICRCKPNPMKTTTTTPLPTRPTCPPVCEIWCEFGNVMFNGCPVCRCNPPPTSQCPNGTEEVNQYVPCQPSQTAGQSQCPANSICYGTAAGYGTCCRKIVTSGQQTVLPTCKSVEDVAIIGAGISGSYAAWRMRNKGLSVSLYEYSNRIGGRCHTVQFPGIPDVNVEMGAMRFKPLDHPLLNETIHALGLNAIDFRLGFGSGSDTLFFLRGKHLRYNDLAANAPYNLHPGHRIHPDLFQWYIFKNYTNVNSSVPGYASAPKKLFHKSLDGVPLYRQSRKSFYSKYFTADTEQYLKDISAFDTDFVKLAAANGIPRRDPTLPSDMTPKPVMTVQSGFQSVPETLVDRFLNASLKHSFHRNHHLRSLVKNQYGHYVLTFQPTQTVRGVTTDNMNLPKKVTCAKKVLLAIPRLALERLDWDVLKQPEVMDYIQNSLEEAKAGKIYFAYGTTWWRNFTLASPYAISTTPLRQTYDYGASPSTRKGVLNPAYFDLYTSIWKDSQHQGKFVPGVGDDTLAMTSVGVNLARRTYATILNVSVNVVQQPDYAVMRIWDDYPIGTAWYNWKSEYIWEEVENKMTRPSLGDDVFIISNTFSKTQKQDWVEGALEIVERTFAKYFPGV